MADPGARTAPIRVLCYDDDESTVRFYQLAIDAEPDMACAGIGTDLRELRGAVERSGATLLVLDLTMPGWDTLEELAQLKHEVPQLKALIVSGFEDDARVARALEKG